MRTAMTLVASALVLTACGIGDAAKPDPRAVTVPAVDSAGIVPILASSELVHGPNRFLFMLTDGANRPIAGPDVRVGLTFYDVDADADQAVFQRDARFLWAVEDVQGLYVADVDYPSAGAWATRFDATSPDGSVRSARVGYDVFPTSRSLPLGARVPSVDTPTATDVGGDLGRITTDPSPEPRFYETSVADALDEGRPFVVVFATPAFCESAACGPTLERAEAVARDHPDMTFIHAEPYLMVYRDGSLQPVLDAEGRLQVAPWTVPWELLSEPFVAVVDRSGNLSAKFEGTYGSDELSSAIEAL